MDNNDVKLTKLSKKEYQGKRYVLNSAVVTNAGQYKVDNLSLGEAREWLDENRSKVISRIGYPNNLKALEILTNHHLEMNRGVHNLEVNDQALVFKLKYRINDVNMKKNNGISVNDILRNYVFMLLTRVQ